MRRGVLMAFAALAALTTTTHAQTQSSSVSYAIADRGAASIETTGTAAAATTGYGRVQPASSTTPAGFAILKFRQGGVLINETGVPGMNAMLSGRTYAEVNGPINTGIAFA